MSVTVVTLPLSVLAIVVTLRQGQRQDKPMGFTFVQQLDAVAEVLAVAVRTQWQMEEQVRRIHDPFPLSVRWANAVDSLMDHWQNVCGTPERHEPIELNGHGDHIVDTFNRIPSGRLVVLGRAGAGKTILTSRFVLTRLARQTLPVPVIFSLGSWDPTERSLRDWQAEQLAATYPLLADRDGTGRSVAEQLLDTGRILPVLDGFDEISESLRGEAITAINAGLRPGEGLLLTSRPEEYQAAVRAGDVLTAAAVIQLEALTVADLATYLPLTTRKDPGDDRQGKWHRILDHLQAESECSPLAEVLTTPLMVALARAIYSDTDKDPSELLAITSVLALEARLLAGFVPAVYLTKRQESFHVDAEDAGRWLRFIARHLGQLGTYDLAWWQLVYAVPRVVVGLISGICMALMMLLGIGVLGLLGSWTNGTRTAWLLAGLVTATAWGVAGGIVIGANRGMRPYPSKMRLRIRSRLPDFFHNFRQLWGLLTIAWIMGCIGGGAAFGLGAARFAESEHGVLFGLVGGLIAGFFIRVVFFLVRVLTVPVDPAETVSPSELLSTDRSAALNQGIIAGISSSAVLWLTLWAVFQPAFNLPFGQVFTRGLWLLGWLLAAAGPALLWMMFVAVWGPWLIARSWLALTGRLPWSVMSFLRDAHRRGVLRQTGGVYQFRHARLQDYLTTYKAYAGPPTTSTVDNNDSTARPPGPNKELAGAGGAEEGGR